MKSKLKLPQFTPKEDVEEYLTSSIPIAVYRYLESAESSVEVEHIDFFNALYEAFETVVANTDRPLSVVNYLKELDLADLERFHLIRFLRILLIRHDHETSKPWDDSLRNCIQFIEDYYSNLNAELVIESTDEETTELYPTKDFYRSPELEFNFELVKKRVEEIPTTEAKLTYLSKLILKYQQSQIGKGRTAEYPFDEMCELLIDKLKVERELSYSNSADTEEAKFFIRDGKKADVIRVMLALYELKLITMQDGMIPTQKEFMKDIGKFFGSDFRRYHSSVNQSPNEDIELKVFYEMIEAVKSKYFPNKLS